MKKSLLLSAVLMLVAGCSEKVEAPPPPILIVKAMTIAATTADKVRSFGGDIRSRNETLVGFSVGGKIAERLVGVGAVVKPGQILARLDATDFALRASETEAQRAMSEADAKRYRGLRAQNFVSQAAVDARDTAQKAAAAQAALARNQADYATLTADHAGVVAEVLAQQGQVVTTGQAVFRLAWEGEREVAISIPEDALTDIKVGSEAEVSLWSTPGKTYRGRVRELAPAADPATRTYAARVLVLDAAPPLGMSATVHFKMSRAPSIVVPMASLFQQGDRPAVWVIGKDNKLSLRPVRISSYSDGGARVEEGLNAGERIVTAGVIRMFAGEIVSVAADAH